MATTTPNFGWSVPTSSDLVKNGAVAIETLGDSIDASLVDLKGGTTGQVLAKASNTDMDFTWSAGASLPTSIGFAAGKNKIINGDFGIWQRGTSFTNPSSGSYNVDRWRLYRDGSGTLIISQQAFTPGTAPVAGYEGTFFYRINQSVAGSGATVNAHQNVIEDVRTFAGQTVTLSYWAKAAATTSLEITADQGFGDSGSPTVSTTVVASQSITTSWVRYSHTFTVPSVSGKTIGFNNSFSITLRLPLNATFTFDIWGVQLEAGSSATAFQTATGTPQGELAACQRYYYRISSTSSNLYAYMTPSGSASSSTSAAAVAVFPVQMRRVPFALDYANLALTDNAANFAVSALSLNSATGSTLGMTLTVTSTGMTAGKFYFLVANNSSSAYLGLSAEF
jgi:hypothetical protein